MEMLKAIGIIVAGITVIALFGLMPVVAVLVGVACLVYLLN